MIFMGTSMVSGEDFPLNQSIEYDDKSGVDHVIAMNHYIICITLFHHPSAMMVNDNQS